MDEPIFDLEDVLYRIQGDKALLLELIDIFLEDVPQRLEGIRQALMSVDFLMLADTAHAVKGAAGNIGAKRLWSLFKTMEDAAKQKDLPLFQDSFDKALLEFAQFQGHMAAVRKQLSS